MVAKVSQDAWVRACLAGRLDEALFSHPFCRYWSARAQADCKAATIFADKAALHPFYQNAHEAPEDLLTGILAVRVDVLLARQFAGVATNISEGLQNLSLQHLTLAQAVYVQLWKEAFSKHDMLPDELTPPLNKQQAYQLLKLFDKPVDLAIYLNECQVFQNNSLSKRTNSVADTITQETEEPIAQQEEPGESLASEQSGVESEQDAPDVNASPKQGGAQERAYLAGSTLPYQVFNQDFDRQVNAIDLAPQHNYAELKQRIAEQLPEFAGLSRRLANKLRRHLMSLKMSAWQDDLEEGYLNSARLALALASPVEARPFRQLVHEPLPQSAVTVLMDCSGSMKHEPLLMAAAWVDALVGALELCQVKVEVLGFTTGHWQDGPVQQQWQKLGANDSAGRLNDLLHIEFKRFEQPWRRARNGLASVLDHQWQKENIDGEALSWAYERLKVRPEPKKLLFVVADAKPFEQSTIENNGCDYLEQDLINRVSAIEQDKQLDLIAIGIGYRICRVYANALQIKQFSDLPEAMLDTLIEKL